MGAMRYKPLDKVRIKSIDWYNENKNKSGNVPMGQFSFNFCNKHLCGTILTIRRVLGDYYLVKENDAYWTDEMIEGLVEEETKPEPKFKVGDSVEVLKSGNVYTISQMKFNGKEFVYTLSNNGSTVSCFSEEEIEFTEEDKYWCDIMSKSDPTTYVLPQGYQFVDENGNVINATKIVLEKKKKEYPKTYEECCKVMNYCCNPVATKTTHKEELIRKFQFLLLYRDAYWKIAGEEMGLGKPWKPDWKSLDPQYIILYQYGGIDKAETHGEGNYILTFPTAEMRDAFKENFDPDIKICKELL